MHIQLDPVGGMAGDMFVAAMLDAFPALEPMVQDAMRAAGLPGRFRCDLVAHADHALVGKRFLVMEASDDSRRTGPQPPHGAHEHAAHEHGPHDHLADPEHGHRPFADIRLSLQAAPLDPGVKHHALSIFTRLAEAEAQVHGATLDTVSFHELGEWDSIADIVAAAALIHASSPATWFVSPLPLGHGFVKSAHGMLPVPAPATTLLLRGLSVRDDGIGGERVTPTGAAIARHLMSLPGEAPRDRVLLGAGLGFGTRSLPGVSNSLRVLVFETRPSSPRDASVTSIEFEVDDQTPEDLAIGLDHVRAHGSVIDVIQAPAFGKKGRMAISVRVLCRSAEEEEVVALCFLETTTLGVRLLDVRRHTLARSQSAIRVLDRDVEIKQADRATHTTTKVEADSLHNVAGHEERERLRRAAASAQRRD